MRDEESGWIHLHVGEFFLVWSAMRLGELPASLGIPHVGRTPAKRAELAGTADAALAARGLGTVGQPARDLAGLLRALAEPELLLDLRTESDGLAFRAVGAAGRQVVCVGVAGTEVRIGPVRRANLVASMLDAIAPLPAGVGSPANVRAADYLKACTAGDREGTNGFADALRRAGIRPPEINTLVRAVTGRAGGGGFGGSAHHGPGTRRTRAGTVISWVDTVDGRYVFRRAGDWITVTPADPARLRLISEELVADLAR